MNTTESILMSLPATIQRREEYKTCEHCNRTVIKVFNYKLMIEKHRLISKDRWIIYYKLDDGWSEAKTKSIGYREIEPSETLEEAAIKIKELLNQ